MADTAQTPEAVAYQLMQDVLALAEGGGSRRTRETVLQTYADCLRVTRPEVLKVQPTHGRSSF